MDLYNEIWVHQRCCPLCHHIDIHQINLDIGCKLDVVKFGVANPKCCNFHLFIMLLLHNKYTLIEEKGDQRKLETIK